MRRAAQVLCSLSLSLLALAPSACGGDDEDQEQVGLTTKLRGIYAIDSWTSNEAGCDAEGASVLEMMSNKKLAVKLTEFFGVELVIAVPCADATSCAEDAEAGIFGIFAGAALFDRGSDAAGWDGDGSSHAVNNGVCEGNYFTQRMEVIGDKRVKVETRTFEATFPAEGTNGDSFDCPLESAKKAAAGQPCETLTVITATYEQSLADPPK
jgi:hypothetical protein